MFQEGSQSRVNMEKVEPEAELHAQAAIKTTTRSL